MSKTKRSENPSKKSPEVKRASKSVYDKELDKLRKEVLREDGFLTLMVDDGVHEDNFEKWLIANGRGEACEDDAESIVAPTLERVLNESDHENGSPLGRKLWGDESKGECGLMWSELMEKMKKTL